MMGLGNQTDMDPSLRALQELAAEHKALAFKWVERPATLDEVTRHPGDGVFLANSKQSDRFVALVFPSGQASRDAFLQSVDLHQLQLPTAVPFNVTTSRASKLPTLPQKLSVKEAVKFINSESGSTRADFQALRIKLLTTCCLYSATAAIVAGFSSLGSRGVFREGAETVVNPSARIFVASAVFAISMIFGMFYMRSALREYRGLSPQKKVGE